MATIDLGFCYTPFTAFAPDSAPGTLPTPGAPGIGIANLQTWDAKYFVAYPDTSAGIRVSRSDFTTPPFASGATDVLATADPDDRHPHLALDNGGFAGDSQAPLRLWLAYARGGGAYRRSSDDGGETWSDEEAMSVSGSQPRVVYGAAGERLEAALVPGATDSDPATINGAVQYPGDASPGAAVTFVDNTGAPLQVESDGFDLALEWAPEQRMIMVVRIAGEGATSSWASAAYDYSTWEPVG